MRFAQAHLASLSRSLIWALLRAEKEGEGGGC